MNSSSLPQRATVRKKKPVRKRKKKGFFRTLSKVFLFFVILLLAGGGWLYFAPSAENLRYTIADTLITTQHRHWAKYIIGEEELKARVAEYNNRFEHMGDEKDTHAIQTPSEEVKE